MLFGFNRNLWEKWGTWTFALYFGWGNALMIIIESIAVYVDMWIFLIRCLWCIHCSIVRIIFVLTMFLFVDYFGIDVFQFDIKMIWCIFCALFLHCVDALFWCVWVFFVFHCTIEIKFFFFFWLIFYFVFVCCFVHLNAIRINPSPRMYMYFMGVVILRKEHWTLLFLHWKI